MVALSQLVLLITTKVVGTGSLGNLQSGLLGVGGAAGIATGAIVALTTAAIAFAALSLKKYFEFSVQMGLLAGATQATTEEFTMLEDESLRLGRTLGTFTATEAATAMKLLAFSGFEVNEIMQATEQIMRLAIATQTDLALATDITARALRTFSIDASDVGRVTDVLTETFSSSATTIEEMGTALSFVGPVAATSGLSLEETAAAIATLANVGIRGSKAGTQLRQVFLRIQAPTSGAIDVLKQLGVEMFELGPAAQATQRALLSSTQELRDLENQMKKTSDATRELDQNLTKLNIAEAKNRLEIMKIRDQAADEGRDLTASELDQIDRLEAANDDLAISQQELSIQRQELALEADMQKQKEEQLNATIEEQTELFNSQKGELKDLVSVIKEFEGALTDLSDAQKIEAINTIFGIRAISGFQTLLDNVDQLEAYTEAIRNSSGATQEQSEIVEQAAGVAWKEFTSSIETFMIEVGGVLAPMLIMITDAVVKMTTWLDILKGLIEAQVVAWKLFMPLVEALVYVVQEFDEELRLLATGLGYVIAALGVLVVITNPLIVVLGAIIAIIAVVGFLTRVMRENEDLMKIVKLTVEVFSAALDILAFTFGTLIEAAEHFMGPMMRLAGFLADILIPLIEENKIVFEILGAVLLGIALAPLAIFVLAVVGAILVLAGLIAIIAGFLETAALMYEAVVSVTDAFLDWFLALEPVKRELQDIKDLMSDIGDFGGSAVDFVGRQAGKLPGAALGDLITAPTVMSVGEIEPEIVTPVSQLAQDAGVGGGTYINTNDTYTINLNVPEGSSGFEILEMIRDAIEEEQTNKRGSVFNSASG